MKRNKRTIQQAAAALAAKGHILVGCAGYDVKWRARYTVLVNGREQTLTVPELEILIQG